MIKLAAWAIATILWFLAWWLIVQFVLWDWSAWPLETLYSRLWLVASGVICAIAMEKVDAG